MKTLQESLFDNDLASKDPIVTQWLKDKIKKDRGHLFTQLDGMMNIPDPDDYPEWISEDYEKHQLEYDWIARGLYDAFNKQNFYSWFSTSPDATEDGYADLEEKGILEDFNMKCEQFFKKSQETELGAEFVLYHGQLPDFFVEFLKSVDEYSGYINFDHRYMLIKDWGIEFYDDYGDQQFSFYGCPKGLDPKVKKLLYN